MSPLQYYHSLSWTAYLLKVFGFLNGWVFQRSGVFDLRALIKLACLLTQCGIEDELRATVLKFGETIGGYFEDKSAHRACLHTNLRQVGIRLRVTDFSAKDLQLPDGFSWKELHSDILAPRVMLITYTVSFLSIRSKTTEQSSAV